MKKTLLVLALAFGVSNSFAQLTNKKGEPYLPETDDWAISFDVDPIFNYVGNAFNHNTNNAPGVGFVNGNHTIIGKKFTSATDAFRVLVRIGLTSVTDKNLVTETGPAVVFPNVAPTVEDKRKKGNTTIGIGVGKEMRRGKTRLQGVYGADAMLWLSSSKTTFTYGNDFTATPISTSQTSTPVSTDFTQIDPDGTFSEGAVTSRTLTSKSGMTIGIGVRGFIGAEYFIFPKISIAAEYGWGIGFQTSGKGKTETESVQTNGSGNAELATQETETAGSSRFGIDTDLNQGTIFGFRGSDTGTASLRAILHF